MKNATLYIIGGLVLVIIIGYFMVTSSNQAAIVSEKAQPSNMVPSANDTKTNSKTIVDIAKEDGSFTTLVTAIQAAELAETLSGAGPFTVFAPTDEAFAKLPAGTVETLLQDKEKLTAILTYHVVPGKLMAADVVKMTTAKTVQGQNISITTDNGTVMIGNATVIKTDIEANNGVIHVIDTVMLPQ